MTETYQTTLSAIKAQCQVMDVLPIMDDAMAQKVLIAWPRIRLTQQDNPEPMPDNPIDAWRWLWAGLHYDDTELAAIAGVHVAMIRPKVDQLRGNHLIFPDGTIARMAEQLMNAKAAEAVNNAISMQRKSMNDARG